jgi:hypothetical protein
MSETTLTTSTRWHGTERRTGTAPAPLFGELLVECAWRPTDRPLGVSDGWLRAKGYAPDRRTR